MWIERFQRYVILSVDNGRDHALNGVLGMISESGKMADIVRAWMLCGENQPLPKDALVDVCGELLRFVAETLHGLCRDMGELYRLLAPHFAAIHRQDADDTPWELVMHIAQVVASADYDQVIALPNRFGFRTPNVDQSEAIASLIGVMVVTGDLLERYCDSSLEDAMGRYILKEQKAKNE